MNQRGGCCIARYAGGAYDTSKVDRIMMRYRPIAPKPPTSNTASSTPENSEPSVKTGRGKKRNTRDTTTAKKRCRTARKNTKSSPENTDSSGSSEKSVKTLSFLPEAPEAKESKTPERSGAKEGNFPMWLSFGHVSGHVGSEDPSFRVGSWVKVECVTETWVVDGYNNFGSYGRNYTDEERVAVLDVDTCPGFVSDGLNRVRWMNAAYRRMAAGGGAAALVVVGEGVVIPAGCAGFTCRVRVVTCGKEKNCKTVPCDVWRMECGGFAWRLDTAAALSLGR